MRDDRIDGRVGGWMEGWWRDGWTDRRGRLFQCVVGPTANEISVSRIARASGTLSCPRTETVLSGSASPGRGLVPPAQAGPHLCVAHPPLLPRKPTHGRPRWPRSRKGCPTPSEGRGLQVLSPSRMPSASGAGGRRRPPYPEIRARLPLAPSLSRSSCQFVRICPRNIIGVVGFFFPFSTYIS